MYTQSLPEIRDDFFRTFGQYMAPVPSHAGQKINWINYKTGNKSIRFVLHIDNNQASIQVKISDPAVYETMKQLRPVFESMAGNDWTWEDDLISAALFGKDIRKRSDWPELIAFFKQRLMALDTFWEDAKDGF